MTPRPPDRTPAGAYLKVRRGRRWTRVEIDRISISDASPEQAVVVHRLSLAAARWAVRHGKRGGVGFGEGVVIWSATVETARADDTLAAFLALEAGDDRPAVALAELFEQATAGTTPEITS